MGGATPLMPVGRPSGRTVHPGLAPAIVRQVSVRRSFRSFPGGDAVLLTITDEVRRTMNIYRLDGTLWLAASCKLQYYANEGCKTCASLAGLLLTFISCKF